MGWPILEEAKESCLADIGEGGGRFEAKESCRVGIAEPGSRGPTALVRARRSAGVGVCGELKTKRESY